MDGQNFQNDQNNQNGQTSGSTENTYSGSYQGSSYQSNTYQDNNNYQSSTYQSSAYQSNNYQDNTQNVYSSTYADSAASTETSTPGLAVASLVMGIVSIVLSCCCGVGIVFAIAGIIMAISANKQVKTGVATAGLICSIVGGVFSLIGLAYWVLVFIGVASDPSLYY